MLQETLFRRNAQDGLNPTQVESGLFSLLNG
jgi:hypothetical protein